MKRRTRQALPALYSQVRAASTAAKLRPLYGTDVNVSTPASNLGKWGRPSPAELAAEAGPSRMSSKLSPGSQTVPPRRSWAGQGPSQDSMGKWAAPGQRDATPPFTSTLSSRNDRWGRGRDREPTPRREPPGSRHDFLPQDPPKRHHDPRTNASKRDSAPHLNNGTSFTRDRPLAPHLRGDSTRIRESAPRIGRTTGNEMDRLRQTVPRSSFSDSTSRIKTKEGMADEYDEAPSADSLANDALSHLDSRRNLKSGKDKTNFKTRGSIASQFRHDAARVGGALAVGRAPLANKIATEKENQRKRKAKAFMKVTPNVFIPSTVSVGQLARLLNVRIATLQRKMADAGMAEESSYDHILTSEYAALLAEEFGRNPVINDEAAFDIYPRPPPSDPSTLPSRPPVVTIMGHVDHGKTTLLDTLRSTSVAKGEAGGITQHIGAFSVPVKSDPHDSAPRTITFLDTPGHAAFSAMRARGAGVTDIVVLVVAADDGVMPQTREVIELTKKDEGKVGVAVAINKMDKPGVDVDNVTKALMVEGIQLESYGGDIPGVPVSGLTGLGLDDLTETISAMAELQDLRAERDGQVQGYVLESNIRKGLGPVATVLILRGCLNVASHLIAGTAHAKVRIMTDSSGKPVKEAYPGMAVTVSGWKELPNAGDEVLSGSESDIKKALANRIRKAEVEASLIDMDAINNQRIQDRKADEAADADAETAQVEKAGPKELRLVIKGDVSGSVEAVEGALQGIGNKEAIVKIVSSGVGDVTESDVMMAKAVEGMVVAFSVQVSRAIEAKASAQDVPIYSSTIIYRIMEEVRNRVAALLPPIIEKKVTGEANVLELFEINLKGRQTKQVAGCRVINGLVEKSKKGRVIRDGATMYEGPLETLKQGKKDLTEVRKGMECGLSFVDFQDLRADDLIQMYEEIEKSAIL